MALDIARILLSPLDLLRVSLVSVLCAVKAESGPKLLPAGWVVASMALSKVSEERDLPLLRVCFWGPLDLWAPSPGKAPQSVGYEQNHEATPVPNKFSFIPSFPMRGKGGAALPFPN